MSEPPHEGPLRYEPHRPGGRPSRWWQPTKPARVLAGVCCVLFAAATLCLWFVDGGRGLSIGFRPAAGWPATAVAAAASVLCFAVALGILGRDDRRP